MIIDAHVHLLGIRPENGCLVSNKMGKGIAYQMLKRAVGLSSTPRDRLDEAYAERITAWARLSELDAIGVLAFDGVYDDRGKLDHARTAVMIGNDYCLEVCRADPKLLPICSINPQRADAIDELERVVEAGSVAIKTLPNSQGFDPSAPKYAPFFQRMAALGIPLLTHTSFEHTIPPLDQSFGLPEKLAPVLDQGTTVIAAHCAGSGVAHPFHEDFDTWLEMLARHPNLYGDISAMASLSRFPYIHRVLGSELARARVILGSDFPIPVNPSVFLKQLGVAEVRRLGKIQNPLQRNLEVFRALGVSDAIMRRGAKLLRGVAPRT